MVLLDSLKSFFVTDARLEPEVIFPAPAMSYSIKPLTLSQLGEVLRLNIRCFCNGDSYTRHTFDYLLNEPRTLGFRTVTPEGEMVAFVFVMVKEQNSAHLTTIGVAPEHRRRGLAAQLLDHVETSLRKRGVGTLMLEVRVSNSSAQELYRRAGYTIVQRINRYYSDGEDCFLMMRALLAA